ncbi:MAG: hypothetical protein FD183_1162 [Chitinophagaceae bacterium]|nr:MAG: hypothetical protein FD183_1162 [Chitinophagaceae bacterium]
MMPDEFLPSVDLDFLESQILGCGKVLLDSKVKVGNTTSYVLDNNKAMHKRLIIIRELKVNEVNFENATSLAIRLGFMGALLEWYKTNKNWKDGGYFEH